MPFAGSLKFDRALSLRAGSSRPAGRPRSPRFRSDSTTTSSARGTTRGAFGTFARASPASRPPARDSPCSLQGARTARRPSITSRQRELHVCEHPQRARDPWPEASTSAKSGSQLTDYSRVPPGRAVVVEAERSRVERGRPRDRGPARSGGCGRTSNCPAHSGGCRGTSNSITPHQSTPATIPATQLARPPQAPRTHRTSPPRTSRAPPLPACAATAPAPLRRASTRAHHPEPAVP